MGHNYCRALVGDLFLSRGFRLRPPHRPLQPPINSHQPLPHPHQQQPHPHPNQQHYHQHHHCHHQNQHSPPIPPSFVPSCANCAAKKWPHHYRHHHHHPHPHRHHHHHLSMPANLYLYWLLMRSPPPQAASMWSQIPWRSQMSGKCFCISYFLYILDLKSEDPVAQQNSFSVFSSLCISIKQKGFCATCESRGQNITHELILFGVKFQTSKYVHEKCYKNELYGNTLLQILAITSQIYCEYIWIIAHAPTIYSDYCSRSNNQMPPPDANMSVQWRHLDQTKYKIKMETYGKLILNKTSCYGCHPQERLRGEILSRFRGVWFPRQNWITAPVPRSNYRLYCKLKTAVRDNVIVLCVVEYNTSNLLGTIWL